MAIQGNPIDDIKEMAHKKPGNKGIKAQFKRGTKKGKRDKAKALFGKDHESKKSLKHNGKLKSARGAGPKGYGRKG